MPRIKLIGPYDFRFHSRGEALERPHIHIRRERRNAKFWIDHVEFATNHGFASHELNQIENLVREHQAEFLEAWYAYFGK